MTKTVNLEQAKIILRKHNAKVYRANLPGMPRNKTCSVHTMRIVIDNPNPEPNKELLVGCADTEEKCIEGLMDALGMSLEVAVRGRPHKFTQKQLDALDKLPKPKDSDE